MTLQTVTIREYPLVQRINGFLASPVYILLVMVATALANFFGWELPVYTAFVLVALYSAIFGKDLMCWIPLVICGYLAPSVSSNPGKNAQSIFNSGHGGEYVLTLAGFVVLAIIIYICRKPRQFFCRKRYMLWGLLGLSIAYLIGGLGSPAHPEYTQKTLLFAALQAGSLLVPYLVISGGAEDLSNHKSYFCLTGFGVGCLLVAQILWIYCTGHVAVGGVINRDNLFTGWGMHNNIGGILAMMLPFGFYLGYHLRRGWTGILAGTVFLAGVIMTSSRSSIMTGFVIYGLCLVLLLIQYHTKAEWFALGLVITVALGLVLLFHRELSKLFADILSRGSSLNHRDEIWAEGWKQFRKHPVFGGGFFPLYYEPYDFSEIREFSGFFPPRWHNTAVQLGASTGVVGMAAYAFHRFQTVRMVIKNRSREVLCMGLSMLALMGTCIFDCHFFNIGPILFYAMGLAFVENTCNFGREMI